MLRSWQRVLLRASPTASAAGAPQSWTLQPPISHRIRCGAPRPASPAGSCSTGQSYAFSLVELVISMAILSVGLVGAMRVFPVGLRASARSEMTSRAGMVAQRTIESLKLIPWEQLAEGATTAEDGPFLITTQIARPVVEHLVDPTRLKLVEVDVQWQQDGRPRSMTFVTYLHREER